MKKTIITISALLTIGLVIGIFTFNQAAPDERPAEELINVRTVSANAVDYQNKIFASGKLSAKEEMMLSFKTGGIIQRIYVKEGQRVKKGQLLAALQMEEIDAQTQQADLGQRQAAINIENARLGLQRAQREFENAKGLYEDSVATFEQFDNARIQLDNARNQLEAAETGLSVSQRSLDIASYNQKYSKIIAPSNGIILRKMAEANELKSPGQPVLLFGSRTQKQVIRVNLTDKDIIFVNFGDTAQIEFDAYPGEPFKGTITEIAQMADVLTNTFEVEIAVDDEGKKLLSGFIGKVVIDTRGRQSLVGFPVDALLNAQGKQGLIFTVNEERKAQQRLVDIVRLDGEQVLVKGGLDVGAEVIVEGGAYLEDGQAVLVR